MRQAGRSAQPSNFRVKLGALLGELAGFFVEAFLQGFLLAQAVFGGVCGKCGFDSLPGRGAPQMRS
jgi:hypothetical protein